MIMDTCRNAGLPEPIIDEVAGGFQIIFLKDIITEEYLKNLELNERQIRAVKYVQKEGYITGISYKRNLTILRSKREGVKV